MEPAKSVGVDRSSIYRWMQQLAFRDAYREARREVFSAAVARLQQAASRAVAPLLEIAEDSSQQGAARVGAARTVLDYAVKAIEAEDLSARLTVIEEAMSKPGSRAA